MAANMKALPTEGRGKRRILDFDVEIGRRLRVQRLHRGLGQVALGDAVGISFQQIQKYENGTNRVSAGKLIQIARVLEVPLSVFFDGLEEEGNGDAARVANTAYQEVQAFAATAEGRRLYRAFTQIERPETRRLFLRMMESLAGDQES